MCGLHRRFAPLPSRTLRRIPQAVGVVATSYESNHVLIGIWQVSIPQAVGVVATRISRLSQEHSYVSIPQAVGVVATVNETFFVIS